MTKIANTYYSKAHPKVLSLDGARVAKQIIACFKNVDPSINLKSATLLDVGSSNGAITHYIADFVKNADGIDTDKPAIDDGHIRYLRKNLQLNIFDGRNIPYPNSSFDLIIFRRTYGSAQYPQKLTDEIFRVLKDEGLVYFEGHNKLFAWESDYKIPFLTLFAPSLVKNLVKLLGHKNYYIGRYKTYWELKKLFHGFQIFNLTPKIIKNPKNFKFTNLYKLNIITNFIPLFILKLLEPLLFPDFIWVLKKG